MKRTIFSIVILICSTTFMFAAGPERGSRPEGRPEQMDISAETVTLEGEVCLVDKEREPSILTVGDETYNVMIPIDQVEDLDIEDGDTITITGKSFEKDDETIIIVEELTFESETITIEKPVRRQR